MSALLDERKARVRAEFDAAFAKLPGRPKSSWAGKKSKSAIPPEIKLRILRTWKHTCHITGLKITTETPHFDHVIPLEDGVEEDKLNAEWNLRPALAKAHLGIKTAAENKARDKADRQAKRKLGLSAPKKKIDSAEFEKAEPQKKASKVEPRSKLESLRTMGVGNIARRFQ